MKFSFSTNAFRQYSVTEAATAISAAGFTGLELMCDRPHGWPYDLADDDIARLKGIMGRNRMEIANLNAFMMCAVQDFHHPSWIERDKDFRRLRVEYTLKCIDLAATLGVATISTEPGGPLDGMDRALALEIFMQELDTAVQYAEKRGVTILVEPEPGLLLETSDHYLAFDRAFGSGRVGLNFDVGHFYCMGEDPVETIERLKTHIRHFHLEDIPADRSHRHTALGEGSMDIGAILARIEAIGYDGYVTVELYPYETSAAQVAEHACNYLRRVGGYG